MTSRKPHRRAAAGALILALAALPAHPQGARKSRDAKSPAQGIAVETLDSAAYELHEVADIETRVSLTEGFVKLLAGRRPARCRQLLESLFDDAQKLRREASGATSPAQESDRVLQKIIAVAADFDPKLARDFAERYAAGGDSGGADSGTKTSPLRADVYLGLAIELVKKDPALAAAVAEKSLAGAVYPRTLAFIERLRQKDAALADKFLSSALRSILSRGGNDVNELLLLYPYVFSSEQVPRVSAGGLVSSQIHEYLSVAQKRPVDATAARQFLQAAAQVLLDPARLETGPRQLAAGVEGDIYFLQIIEPLVGTYLPARAAALSARRSLLAQYLSQNQRESLQASSERWRARSDEAGAEAKGSSGVEAQLRRAEETADPDQKDRIYYDAALTAVSERQYEKALDIAGRLSRKSRDSAKEFVTFSIALKEIKDGRLEEAEEIAGRDTDLARRAFLLNAIASALAARENRDLNRATELLNEVETIATRLGPGQEKVATLAGAAAVFAAYENVRSAELLRAAVEAANKVEKFTGDTTVTRVIELADFGYVYTMYDDKLSFSEAVRRQGRKDFNSTLSDVQNLKGRVPRLRAIIALCQAVLSGPNQR